MVWSARAGHSTDDLDCSVNKMELFKCQAVLPFLAVTIGAILADSEPDNGKTLAMTKGDRVPYHATWRLHMKFVEKGKTQEYCGPR